MIISPSHINQVSITWVNQWVINQARQWSNSGPISITMIGMLTNDYPFTSDFVFVCFLSFCIIFFRGQIFRNQDRSPNGRISSSISEFSHSQFWAFIPSLCPKLFDGKGKNAIQQQIACHQRLSQYGRSIWNIPFPAQLSYTAIKQQMHRWLSPTVSLSQQVQSQSKSCQSHDSRYILKMYIVYLFPPHIDTFHTAMIASDGNMCSKKGKRSKNIEQIIDYNDWILSSFSILKKKSGDCCRCRRLSFPKTVHCCVTGLQIWPLYLSGCHLSSVFVWHMSWSMIIRLGGRERRLFWRVGGFNLGALRLLLELLQQRSVY